MDAPNFKDILGRLSVLKSNLPVLASIVIALVAAVLFVPAKLWSSGLKKTVESKSVAMGNRVRSASRDANSVRQWEELAKRKDAYARDANEIELLARQSTQRELLRYDIFPAPADTSAFIFKRFGDKYRAGIRAMLKGLDANDCPSDAELSRGLDDASKTAPGSGGRPGAYAVPRRGPYSTSGRAAYPSAARRPYSGSFRATGAVEDRIRDEICLDKAKSCTVYANPESLAGYTLWGEYSYDVKLEEAVQDCWFYQLGYWVIEDVVGTIGAMNSSSASVLTAPVKRLVSISFPAGTQSTRGTAGTRMRSMAPLYSRETSRTRLSGQQDLGMPSYVTSEPAGAGSTGGYRGPGGPGSSAQNCTGRVSNDAIDIVHFNVSVTVSAKSILPFMKELCSAKEHKFKGFMNKLPQAEVFKHNQITILESSFVPVERSDASHELYRYGDDAVAELDLVCEYVLNKEAYDEIKPESLKDTAEQQTGSAPVSQPYGTRASGRPGD